MTPAHAQSNASLLPDGATDVRMGAVLGTAPSAPGSARRSAFLVPQFSAEWSNGVFVEGLAVGKQMSSDPMLGYGPVLAVNLGAQRADGSSVIRPVTGVFVQYQPLRELALHAQVSIPLLRDTGGALFNFRASTQFVPAAHHWLEFGTGFNAADRRYQQTDFRTAQFQPSGGLRDVFADVQWGWQVSRKITLTASVRAARLQGDAAASPRTRQRTGVANALGFSYSY
ncbi:MipA/OmpV family protein [Pseudoduganella violaceinigra]|uniref:MipA/OmpV family protein n=1 Tax=Pseudoduganella violaceinigra TaxID=246602 RepID=UPI0004226322|nr:MipA/OmpV family protein [Pseudoduganella violaceinigra]